MQLHIAAVFIIILEETGNLFNHSVLGSGITIELTLNVVMEDIWGLVPINLIGISMELKKLRK
ncbi:hypothetical protein ES703_27015 [subsurface metagenome]